MGLVSAFQLLFFLVLLISCAAQHPEGQEKTESHPKETEIQISDQPKPYPVGEKRKNYVPGEILVKFKDGTTEQAIAAIQRELHLETISIVSKANLYLIKILDPKLNDSSGRHEYRQHHPCHSEPFDRLRVNSAKNLLGGATF